MMPVCEEDGYREWLRWNWKKRNVFNCVPNVSADLSVHTSGSRPLLHQPPGLFVVSPSHEEHTRNHATRVHTLSFSPSLLNFPFLIPSFPRRFDNIVLLCAVAVATAHGYLRATHRRIPKSGCVLLALRCGSVLRVYTGGKGVNATCFKEVQDVFTSALTGTLGKSWN